MKVIDLLQITNIGQNIMITDVNGYTLFRGFKNQCIDNPLYTHLMNLTVSHIYTHDSNVLLIMTKESKNEII